MTRPAHLVAPVKRSAPFKATVIVGIVALHAIAIYALVTSLIPGVLLPLSQLIEVDLLKPQKHLAPPPPISPVLIKPHLPNIPVPTIRIAAPARSDAISAVTWGPATQAAPPVTLPSKPSPVKMTSAEPITGTHTTPPYPFIARRLSEEGSVLLGIDISATGAITRVDVLKPSGSRYLDEAAQDWVLRKWRYRPATRNGIGYPTRVKAQIVFNLKNAP